MRRRGDRRSNELDRALVCAGPALRAIRGLDERPVPVRECSQLRACSRRIRARALRGDRRAPSAGGSRRCRGGRGAPPRPPRSALTAPAARRSSATVASSLAREKRVGGRNSRTRSQLRAASRVAAPCRARRLAERLREDRGPEVRSAPPRATGSSPVAAACSAVAKAAPGAPARPEEPFDVELRGGDLRPRAARRLRARAPPARPTTPGARRRPPSRARVVGGGRRRGEHEARRDGCCDRERPHATARSSP